MVRVVGRLWSEMHGLQPRQMSIDETPIQIYMDDVVGQLRRAGRLPLSALFTPPRTRARLVGFFLAILELTRGFCIWAEQEETFGDIWLSLPPEPSPFSREPLASA